MDTCTAKSKITKKLSMYKQKVLKQIKESDYVAYDDFEILVVFISVAVGAAGCGSRLSTVSFGPKAKKFKDVLDEASIKENL